jgi:hypothetical protein
MTIFHEPQCLISSNLIGLRYFDIIIIFASKYIKIIYIFLKKLFLILNQNDLKVYKNNFKLFFFSKVLLDRNAKHDLNNILEQQFCMNLNVWYHQIWLDWVFIGWIKVRILWYYNKLWFLKWSFIFFHLKRH